MKKCEIILNEAHFEERGLIQILEMYSVFAEYFLFFIYR